MGRWSSSGLPPDEFVTGEPRVKPVVDVPEPEYEPAGAGTAAAVVAAPAAGQVTRSSTPWGWLVVGAVVLAGSGI